MKQNEDDAKYKIVCRYLHEMENIRKGSKSRKALFDAIFEEEKERFDLPETFRFPYKTALSRIRRRSLQAKNSQCPLIHIEKKAIDLIICMSKLKRSLTVSEAISLINDLIDGTCIQEKLIEWKLYHKIYQKNPNDMGKIGKLWWYSFMRRNGHLIKSKSGKKYALDRANFTSYLNFKDMYDHIEDILVHDSKVATYFDTPKYMNRDGDVVEDEADSYGLKCNIKINRPDMCVVMDEVGCNLSQTDDNANGGQMYVCEAGTVPYESCSTKNCHFTCLGLTRLDGEALMCVVIIQGKKRDVMTESGIDWSALKDRDDIPNIANGDEAEFFQNNFGEGNLFPGGPSCYYKGINVPAFVTFTEGGGINGEILTKIFQRLDRLHVYDEDRKKGQIPFVLLDGHQSRFDLGFLEYINADEHKWNVCLGVPYGTAVWQVADSSEQNGLFKMLLGEKKKELFRDRLTTFVQSLHLIRTDILPLVNSCWPPAFADVINNLKAISARGWYPYTRKLLLDWQIRATITEELLEWEKTCGLMGDNLLIKLHDVQYIENELKVELKCNKIGNKTTNLNFNGGSTARYVSTTIMSEVDRQSAREHIQKMKDEGLTVKERLDKINRTLTAGKMTLDVRKYHLDFNIRDHVKHVKNIQKHEELAKKRKEELTYMINCHKADKAIEKYGVDSNIVKWRNMNDITAYLKPLKTRDDSKMPTNRAAIEKRCLLWRYRHRMELSTDETVLESFNKWLEEEDAKKQGKSK